MIIYNADEYERILARQGKTLDSVRHLVVWQREGKIAIDPRRSRPGLGDIIAAGLSAIGITEERVEKLVGGPCGCPGRKAALNRLGRKLGIGK